MKAKSILFAILALSFFTAFASSTTVDSSKWDLKVMDQPRSFQQLSNISSTVQVINLTTDSGDPLNKTDIQNTPDYRYNNSTTDMNWLNSGYWYAEFQVNNATNGTVEFEAQPGSPGSNEANATRTFDVGNMEVEILNDLSGEVEGGSEKEIEVNVTDVVNSTFEDQANVDIHFTNSSWSSDIYRINEDSDGDFYGDRLVNLPSKPDTTYILHANATNSSSNLGYSDKFGASSVTLKTAPALDGHIDYLEANGGCNNVSYPGDCETGATLDTGFNVTTSSSDNVNFTVSLAESDSGNWAIKEFQNLSDNSIYEGSVELPDINTTKYEKKYILEWKVTGNNKMLVKRRNISYSSFTMTDDSAASVPQGEDYDVKLRVTKPFSGSNLPESRFKNGSLEIEYPNGTMMKNFTLSDMTYSDSVFQKSVAIPSDAPADTGYEIVADLFNKYGEKRSSTALSGWGTFEVTNVSQTFNTSQDIEMEINSTGVHEAYVTLWSQTGSDRNLTVDVDGIDNFTEVNEGKDIELPANSKKDVKVEFNVTYVEDDSGDITFNDSEAGYTSTVDVEIETPLCLERDGTLCMQNEGWMNVTQDDYSGVNESVFLYYLGDKNTSVTVEASVEGEVSDYVTVESSFDLSDYREMNIDYNSTVNGTYTGKLTFTAGNDSVSIKTALESNAEISEQQISTGLTGPGSLDIGNFTSGETVVETVDLTNTGNARITDISVSSGTFTVFSDVSSIDAGSTKTASLTFQSLSSTSGTVEFSGTSAGKQVTTRIDVSGTQKSSTGSTGDTSDRSTDSSEEDTSGTGEGSQESEFESPGSGTTSNTQQSSGPPIVPLAAGLFAVLLVGFVAYSSIELEEGDPLYNLLGE